MIMLYIVYIVVMNSNYDLPIYSRWGQRNHRCYYHGTVASRPVGIQRGNKQTLEVNLDWYLGLHKTYPRILEKKAKKKKKKRR
jgi:hypothetical protein